MEQSAWEDGAREGNDAGRSVPNISAEGMSGKASCWNCNRHADALLSCFSSSDAASTYKFLRNERIRQISGLYTRYEG